MSIPLFPTDSVVRINFGRVRTDTIHVSGTITRIAALEQGRYVILVNEDISHILVGDSAQFPHIAIAQVCDVVEFDYVKYCYHDGSLSCSHEIKNFRLT